MGQEISHQRFSQQDFDEFYQRLQQETRLLENWLQSDELCQDNWVCGFELEAWLLDQHYAPAPINEDFLERLQHPRVVPELAKFNIEINSRPHQLQGTALRKLHQELAGTWQQCRTQAQHWDADIAMIGILPTLQAEHLHLGNISSLKRYYALNDQVLRQRNGRPLHLEILGREHLNILQSDVMLEAAATSLQVHLQVSPQQAIRTYNLGLLLSAPMVAVSANAPFLLGKSLWEETRIPVFEQAVELGGYAAAAQGPLRRVTFGSGYMENSSLECFAENLEHYPILLPLNMQQNTKQLSHLRLHNGTIWRWNRPLVDFIDGQPHLRIEHRVIPAGPSVLDTIANIAVYVGLVRELSELNQPVEKRLRFTQVRDNFYQAARYGLQTHVLWLDGEKYSLQRLWTQKLLPTARSGLERLELDQNDIDHYLAVISARLSSAQTGAHWQRQFATQCGGDMHALMQAYLNNQQSGLPVHAWS